MLAFGADVGIARLDPIIVAPLGWVTQPPLVLSLDANSAADFLSFYLPSHIDSLGARDGLGHCLFANQQIYFSCQPINIACHHSGEAPITSLSRCPTSRSRSPGISAFAPLRTSSWLALAFPLPDTRSTV
jgi:hypothetical protein